MRTWVFFATLLVAGSHADPEAQAEADADPNPQADPNFYPGQGYIQPAPGYGYGLNPPISYPEYEDSMMPNPNYNDQMFNRPDPNQGGLYPNPDPAFNRPDPNQGLYPNNPDPNFGRPDPNSACALTDQCCNMAQQNCCPNPQQKCYTTWERQCDDQNVAIQCPVETKTHCHDVTVPDCVTKVKVEKREFSGEKCEQLYEEKCFDYTAVLCDGSIVSKKEPVSWVNQRLKKLPDKITPHCEEITTQSCSKNETSRNETYYVTEPYTVNVPQKICKPKAKQNAPRQIEVVVYDPQYKNMCYEVKYPVCTTNPCQQSGVCESGTQPCSTDQTTSSTICPDQTSLTPNMPPNAGCQQVQNPVCQDQTRFCGFQQPAFQQCCRLEKRKICRQVLIRVPRKVTQTIPGGVSWENVCETIDYPVTKYRRVPKTRVVNSNFPVCKPVTKTECHDIVEPQYQIEDVNEEAEVEVPLPTCNRKEETRTVCERVPSNIKCNPYKIYKALRITYAVCDQRKTIKQCFKILVANCQAYGGPPSCRMVPKQVCQTVCAKTDYCNTCNNFVNGPGFGNCASSTCGNAIMPLQVGLQNATTLGSQYGQYPGGQYPGYTAPYVEADDDFFNVDN